MSAPRWSSVADGVWVARHDRLDLSTGLVVGDERCLVVDTGCDPEHGAELAGAVRRITGLRATVVLTHAHFDHCGGTVAFTGADVWAHPRCAADLARGGHAQHVEARRFDADAALVVPIVPTHTVDDEVVLDLGGRAVVLRHPGRGHTDHDLVVAVPDVAVLFTGDLVEQGAPPDVGDAFPAEWPATLDALVEHTDGVVVPGHGDPVDRAFVGAQRAELNELAALCQAVRRGERDVADALAHSPYPPATTRAALARDDR